MNERIRQLAEQAKCLSSAYNTGAVDLEKFAELIVRDCIIQCERGLISFCMDSVHNQAIDSCINRIKKHFEVLT